MWLSLSIRRDRWRMATGASALMSVSEPLTTKLLHLAPSLAEGKAAQWRHSHLV